APPDNLRCNVVNEDRYCDQSMYDGAVGAPGLDQCVGAQGSTDGVCFAVCSFPAFDANANGAIDGGEEGQQLACGTGFHCSTEVGASVGIALTPATQVTCDPAACPAGTKCAACGVGDME